MTTETPVETPKPYIPCQNCSGNGILIGPFDPNTLENEIRECPKCDGWGIKILRGSTYRAPNS